MAIQRPSSRADGSSTPSSTARLRRTTFIKCTLGIGVIICVTALSTAHDFLSNRPRDIMPAIDNVPRELLRVVPRATTTPPSVPPSRGVAPTETRATPSMNDNAAPAHYVVDHGAPSSPQIAVTDQPPSTPAPPSPTTGTEVFASQPMEGPLCVFIPANGHDEKHLKEVEAVLEAWGDASTLLFTENPIVMERTEEVATRKGIARALVEMEGWKKWHTSTILSVASLRRRGATNESLRGRGQLSIPLFYWISQLVKNKDPLVQNCKWFMKCDTDTYLRRKLFEAKQLSTLDPQRPFHVGVPLNFNTRPYHTTFRYINFQYNIGGPGYTFSRGLMEKVRIEECIESMTRDPVLLIHDDVATGYCASYHVDGAHRINANATVTSSLSSLVEYVADRDTLFETLGCLDCVAALHPVTANLMITLGKRDQLKTLDRRLCIMTEQCTLKFMLGTIPVVGELWRLDGLMQSIQRYWQLNDVRVLDHVNRKIAQVALDQIAAWKSA